METRKEKIIKILKRVGMVLSIGFNVVFLIAIIIGFSGSKKQSNKVNVACAETEVINFEYQNKKMVSYDDEEYTITLTAEEINNFTWENFYNAIENRDNGDAVSDVISSFEYNNLVFDSGDSDEGAYFFVYNDGEYALYLIYDNDLFNGYNSTDFVNYHFALNINGYTDDFDYSLDIVIEYPYYSAIKQAIELDIQANSGTVNEGIFETLTDSTVAFIGSLSSGITAMTSVFYDSVNGNLTAIGLLSVIVVAISLCYFLFRLIIGLIRMRG